MHHVLSRESRQEDILLNDVEPDEYERARESQ